MQTTSAPLSLSIVVIPVFHNDGNIERCISALQPLPRPGLEVIIVDHSIDHRVRKILANLPDHFSILEEDSNLWWAGAINTGISAALDRGANNIILLNDDCLLKPAALTSLLHHAKQNPGAIVAAVQCSLSNSKCLVKATDCTLLGFPTIVRQEPRTSLSNHELLVETRLIVGGRGAVIPRHIFESIGLFDAINLPHYGADHDFYWRCRHAGIKMFSATDAIVEVNDNRTTSGNISTLNNWDNFKRSLTDRKSHRNIRDVRALFKKHYPIRFAYRLGLGLFVLRYFLVFIFRRS